MIGEEERRRSTFYASMLCVLCFINGSVRTQIKRIFLKAKIREKNQKSIKLKLKNTVYKEKNA